VKSGIGVEGKKAGPAVMMELRRKILTEPSAQYGVDVAAGDPWAVVMETGFPGGSASLVCFADGNASLYFSTGGGVIGGFAYENVRTAASDLVEAAGYFLGHFSPVTEFPLPGAGRTRFYVRTGETVLHAEASENDLGEERHPLSKLFFAGHNVITQLREITETSH